MLAAVSVFFLTYQVLTTNIQALQSGCNKQTGPAGAVQCLNDRQNKKPEWATCVTSAYIKEQSSGTVQCKNKTDIYCQYRCSVEEHHFDASIARNCTCDSNTAIPKPLNTSIPSWCYSPPGTTCQWYEQCLEKVHPCQGSSADYAIKYAKRFCALYDDSYHKFTQKGRIWIDSVRRCLQIALTPLLRPWHKQTTCQMIQNIAFGSHTCCYTGGSSCTQPGSPSICRLSPFDWWRVFWTIKSAFVLSTTSAAESLKGVLETMKACGTELIKGTDNVAQVQLAMKQVPGKKAKLSAKEMDQMALDMGNLIAEKMQWMKNNIDWFAYAVDGTVFGKPGFIGIRVLLTKKKSNQLFGSRKVQSIKQRVTALASAFENGSLKLKKPAEKEDFMVDSIQSCSDITCSSFGLNVRAPSRGIKTGIGMNNIIAVSTVYILIMKFMN